MMNIGPIELLIVSLMGISVFALPIVTLVIAVLIYARLKHIEDILERKDGR